MSSSLSATQHQPPRATVSGSARTGAVRACAVACVFVVLLAAMSSVQAAAQPIPGLAAEETPLHWAARNALFSVALGLIENGAVVSAPDQFGRTPLHRAVASVTMVELLIDAGANVNAVDMFGRTPLHEALPYPDTVALLLDAGADIAAEDFLGNTPLERTLRYGTGSRNLRVIELLIAAGAGAPRTR